MTMAYRLSAADLGRRPASNITAGLAPAPAPDITLDLSRLLSRVLHPTPTGVDRVEMAYAKGLLRLAPNRLGFAAIHPCGLHGRLATAAAVDFLNLTAERWDREGQTESHATRWRRAAAACFTLAPQPSRPAPSRGPAAYLHLSARGLERRGLLEAMLRREGARFVPFVHDTIPLDHPEYARPDGAARYARKMATVSALASGVLVNSRATAAALAPLLSAGGRTAPIHVAGLGVDRCEPDVGGVEAGVKPYFLMLGTIEPRKNHLLLLHLWRRLAVTLGPDRAPDLVVVGRRGWENEMVLDLLDRCPALQGVVQEHSRVPDVVLRRLLRGARALLLPSFAEGYGLPVIEALALGAPVIASDLPALREAGGGAPDYIDPLDAAAWERAVLDYARPDSPRRAAQLRRMRAWRAPSWDTHVRSALDFMGEICR